MKYFIIFFDESFKEITQDKYNEILDLSGQDGVSGMEIAGSFYKFSDIRKILKETDFYDQYPQNRPTPKMENWNGKGFEGIVKSASKTSHLEALARGLKKAKERLEKQGRETPNIDKLIEFARERYLLLKH